MYNFVKYDLRIMEDIIVTKYEVFKYENVLEKCKYMIFTYNDTKNLNCRVLFQRLWMNFSMFFILVVLCSRMNVFCNTCLNMYMNVHIHCIW